MTSRTATGTAHPSWPKSAVNFCSLPRSSALTVGLTLCSDLRISSYKNNMSRWSGSEVMIRKTANQTQLEARKDNS